jgi:hypothetical protein
VTIGNSYSLPTSDGTAGQIMTTDGNGNVSFTSNPGKTYDITASSTTGGADFNLNSDVPTTDTIKFTEGSGITIVATSANEITITGTDPTKLVNGIYEFVLENTGILTLPGAGTLGDNYGTGILDISLQPASGGLVTVNSNNGENYIEFDDTNAEIGTGFGTGTPYVWRFEQSGATSFPNYTFPLADGSANQVLETDGTGNLSWVNASGAGTTYTYTASSTTGGANLDLIGSNATTNTVKLTNAGHITAVYTSATEVTLGSDATDANTASAIIARDASGDFSAGQGTFDSGITINGSTSGSSTFTAPATGSTLSYVLPGTAGAASTVLTNDGSGNLSWAPGGGSTFGNLSIGVVTANTIASTDTNGNIELTPNGTGRTSITNSTLIGGMILNGSTSGTVSITPSAVSGTQAYTLPTAVPAVSGYVLSATTGGVMSWVSNTGSTGNITIGVDTVQTVSTTSGDLILQTAAGVNAGTITLTSGANGNIIIAPDGTGDVYLNADTVRVGDAAAAAIITTNGAGNLTLSTNSGTNSGTILINQGIDGDITLTPNATTPGFPGSINLASETVYVGQAGGIIGIISSPASANLKIWSNDGATSGANATGEITIRGSSGGRLISLSTINDYVNGNIGMETIYTIFGAQNYTTYPNAYIGTSSGTAGASSNLVLQTSDPRSYNWSNITITSGANGNISLTPTGTGRTNITNGTIANNLQFNGSTSGTVEFAAPSVAGTQAYTLPTAVPAVSGYVLSATTGGVMSWIANTTSTFGNITIGVDSAQTISTTSGSLILQTAGGVNSGTITINGSGQDMVLSPNPLGEVYLDADVYVGRANTNVQISSNGNADLYLVTGNIAGGGQVRISNGANADVEILPSGTGNVLLTADTVVVGDPATAATITTNGAGDLVLNTNAGGSSGSITIPAGANTDISIQANGSGSVILEQVVIADDTINNYAVIGSAQDIRLQGYQTTDPAILLIGHGQFEFGDGSNVGIIIDANTATIANSTGNLTIEPAGAADLLLKADTVQVGDANAAATITTNGTGDLTISTNGGTNSGTIAIANGVNGNITFAPNGTGQVVIDGGYWPVTSTSVTVNSVLTNDGSGNLSWALPGGGGSTFGNVSIGVDTDQTISTSSGNLVLQTAAGVNAGTITLASGTNGNITIEPNGTGDVLLNADIVQIGDANAAATLTTNGTGNLTLSTNNGSNSGTILITQGANANITITPNGTGDVVLSADTVQVGDANATATVTTNGTGDLVLNTNSGSNAGSITLANGANGNITIEPNGTGDVLLNADTVQIGDSGAAATLTTNGAGNLTINTNNGTNASNMVFSNGVNGNITVTPNGTGVFIVSGNPSIAVRTNSVGGSIIARANTTTTGTYLYPSFNTQKVRTDILTAAMTNEPAVLGFSVRDSAGVTTNTGRFACTYQGTASNPFFRASVSADGFTTEVVAVVFGGGVATWGSAGTYTHTTSGTTDLILSTNSGTNSGTITINDGANNNIALAPNGTGRVAITNPLRLASYTAAALTALTGAVGDVAAVTNSASGGNPNGMLAFWDTTNARWSYVHDNSAV